MSNGWKLELSRWGDGTTRLTFWDSLHGEDEHFILTLGNMGIAEHIYYDENGVERHAMGFLAGDLLRLLDKLTDREREGTE